MKDFRIKLLDNELSAVKKKISLMIDWIFKERGNLNLEMNTMISEFTKIINESEKKSRISNVLVLYYKFAISVVTSFTYLRFRYEPFQSTGILTDIFTDDYCIRMFILSEISRVSTIIFRQEGYLTEKLGKPVDLEMIKEIYNFKEEGLIGSITRDGKLLVMRTGPRIPPIFDSKIKETIDEMHQSCRYFRTKKIER